MKRFLAIVCSLSFLLGTITGCRNSDDNSDSGLSEDEKTNYTQNYTPIELDTIHGGKCEETEEYIVKNGATDYQIVIPANATTNENKAAVVLQNYFNKSTGITLEIVRDTQISWNSNSKLIAIGNNVLAQQNDLIYDDYITTEGFRIKTVGKSVFLVGEEYGVLFSAYELLAYWFNFDCYAGNCYSYDEGVSNLKLQNFDIREEPDFMCTPQASGFITYSEDTALMDAWRYRRGNNGYTYIGWVRGIHNFFNYVPYEEYGEHTEWYSDCMENGKPAQLCFSRDPEGLMAVVLDKMKQLLIENPKEHIVSFSLQDNYLWCSCSECTKLEQEYGVKTAGLARFYKNLGNALQDWADTEYGVNTDGTPKRDVKVLGLAYNETEQAPAKYDEVTGKYLPIDESVDMGENVDIEYCPHHSADYQIPFDEEGNEPVLSALQSWGAICDELWLFTYNVINHEQYLLFHDTFDWMQRSLQVMRYYGATYLYDLGEWNSTNATAFNVLKEYLMAKLKWNCQADVSALTDRWFKNYFGVAEEPMRNMFETLRNKCVYLHATGVFNSRLHSGSGRGLTEDHLYDEGFVRTLLDYIDQAYLVTRTIQATDSVFYETLCDRICLESISPRYIEIERFGNFMPTTIDKLKSDFKADCERLKVDRRGEGYPIDTLWKRWGI